MRAPSLMVKPEMATASPGNELLDDLPPSPPPLPRVSEFTEESGYENLNPVPPLQTQMRTNPPDQEMETVPPSGANEITDEPALKKSRTITMREETPPVSDTRDSEIRTKGTPSGCFKNIIPVSVYTGGEVQFTHMGATYSIPPIITFSGTEHTTYKDVTDEIYKVLKLSKELFSLNIQARYNGVSTGSFFFTLLAINDDKAWRLIYEMTISGMNWRIIELYVNLVPNQTSQNDNPNLISSHGTSMHASPSQTMSFNYPTQAYWSRPQQVSNQACQNYKFNPTSLAGTSSVAQQSMPMHVIPSQTIPQGSCSRPNPIPRNFPSKSSRTQQNTPMHAKPCQTKPKPPLPQISELIILEPECDNLNPVTQSPRAVHETPDQLIKACQTDVGMNPLVCVTTDTGPTGDEQMEVSHNKDDDYELIILEPECDNLNPMTQSPQAVHETPDQLIKACQTDVGMNPLVSITTNTNSTGDEKMEVSQIDTSKDDDYELIILEPECDNLNPVTQSPQAVNETPDQIKTCQPDVAMNPIVSVTTDTGPTGDEQMEVSQIDTNKDDEVVVSDIPPTEMAPPGGDMRDSETPAPLAKRIQVTPSGSCLQERIAMNVYHRGIKTTQFYRRKRRIIARETGNQSNQNYEEQFQGGHKSLDTNQAQPEAQQRRRGQPKGWRKDTDMKKEKSWIIITNKCLIDAAMTFFHKEVLKKLNPEHIRLIATTPFLHLFAFPKGTQVSNAIIHQILLMWDNHKGFFKFKGCELHLTSEEVSVVMGLPCKGSTVIYKRKMVTYSTLQCRHFKHNQDISRKQLEKAILKAIDDRCVETDVVGLLIMYLFTTILFPQAGGCVPVHMFHYMENIDRLCTFNWGDAVYQMLMDNIPLCSVWCHLMEKNGGENSREISSEEVEKKKTLRKPSGYLPGCTLALIVWFFEHTKIQDVEKYTGHIPRYLNWKLNINWRRASFRSALVHVRKVFVNLVYDKSEEILRDFGFVAASYMEMLVNINTQDRMHNRDMFRLLIEMAPVFWKFGMTPCPLLIKEAPLERFKELNYEEKSKIGVKGLLEN